MQKMFFVTKNSEKNGNAPVNDRFQRIDKLNELLINGWEIAEFKVDGGDAYFLLKK